MRRCSTCGTPIGDTGGACDRCTFSADAIETEPQLLLSESTDALESLQVGTWSRNPIDSKVVVALIVGVALFAAGALFSGFGSEKSPAGETPETAVLAEAGDVVETVPAGNVDEVAPPGNRPGSLLPAPEWDGDELLLAFSGPNEILVFDLVSASRTVWLPPDPLIEETPLAVGNSIVVVTESGAYSRAVEIGSSWKSLGGADRVRPSTKTDRLWLRTPVVKVTGLEADFLWTEVDLDGIEHRSMNRTETLDFPTPEIVWGFEGGIFRFDDAAIPQWRLMSDFARPVAVGKNQVISRECTASLDCSRVWYDTTDGSSKGQLHADLALNVEVHHGALLSDDGRFVVTENLGGGAEIYSIATKDRLINRCVWGHPIRWSAESDLVACGSFDGVEVYDANLGISLGLALGVGEFSPLFAFVGVDVESD